MTIPQSVKYSLIGQESFEISRYSLLSVLMLNLGMVQYINSQPRTPRGFGFVNFPQNVHQGHISNRSE